MAEALKLSLRTGRCGGYKCTCLGIPEEHGTSQQEHGWICCTREGCKHTQAVHEIPEGTKVPETLEDDEQVSVSVPDEPDVLGAIERLQDRLDNTQPTKE